MREASSSAKKLLIFAFAFLLLLSGAFRSGTSQTEAQAGHTVMAVGNLMERWSIGSTWTTPDHDERFVRLSAMGTTTTEVTSPSNTSTSTTMTTSTTASNSSKTILKVPTLATNLNASTIFAGDTDYDTAFFTAPPIPTAGTMTFYEYSSAGCVGSRTAVGSPINLRSGSSIYDSPTETFSQPGSYYFSAVYSGDATDTAAASLCETLTVLASTISSTSTTTIPTTPSNGVGFGTSNILIGAGIAVVVLGAVGYFITRRGKHEGARPKKTEAPSRIRCMEQATN